MKIIFHPDHDNHPIVIQVRRYDGNVVELMPAHNESITLNDDDVSTLCTLLHAANQRVKVNTARRIAEALEEEL